MKVESLEGASINLVPFEVRHVDLYLRWMQDDYLVRMTATDADLTFEDVVDMQRSWRDDDDKFVYLISAKRIDCDATLGQPTNIVCTGTGTEKCTGSPNRPRPDTTNGSAYPVHTGRDTCSDDVSTTGTGDGSGGSGSNSCDSEVKITGADECTGGIKGHTNKTNNSDNGKSMIDSIAVDAGREGEVLVGDVGLFFSSVDGSGDGVRYDEGELSFMVAWEEYRKRGIGREAVGMVMEYANRKFNTRHFTAKVSMCNTSCLRMLMKMGFVEIGRNDVFQEVSLLKEWS